MRGHTAVLGVGGTKPPGKGDGLGRRRTVLRVPRLLGAGERERLVAAGALQLPVGRIDPFAVVAPAALVGAGRRGRLTRLRLDGTPRLGSGRVRCNGCWARCLVSWLRHRSWHPRRCRSAQLALAALPSVVAKPAALRACAADST
eukprot:1619790-Prymnesium_polylepis.1